MLALGLNACKPMVGTAVFGWRGWHQYAWTTHVERGLEGTMDIIKVIKAGLSSEGILDINNHPSGKSYNESCILQVRRQFRRQIYDNGIPQHLKDWLDRWHTPLFRCSGRFYRHTPITNPPNCRSNDVTTNRPHRGHKRH